MLFLGRLIFIIIFFVSISDVAYALVYRVTQVDGVELKKKQYKRSETIGTASKGDVFQISKAKKYISGDYVKVEINSSKDLAWVKLDAGLIEFYDTRYALLIGVDEYKDPDSKLDYAVRDVVKLEDALLKIGYLEKNIYLLDTPEKTTLKAIKMSLSEIAKRVGQNDSVLIVFSGHGETEKSGEDEIGYLVPSDASPGDEYYDYLPLVFVKERVRKLSAKHVFLVLNACFGGNVFEKVRGSTAIRFSDYGSGKSLEYARDISLKRARQALTAGGAGQTVPDDGPFISAFIEGITTLKADVGDGIITASEVMLYVKQHSGMSITPEKGQLWGHELGDFVFVDRIPKEVLNQKNSKAVAENHLLDLQGIRTKLYVSLRARDNSIDLTVFRDKVLQYVNVERKIAKYLGRKPSLEEIDLSNLDLKGSDFSGFELRKSNFTKSILNNATFDNAGIREVKFNNANLSDASLKGADMYKADLTDAVMRRVDFTSVKNIGYISKWKGANISGAQIAERDREYALYSGAIEQKAAPLPPGRIMVR